MAGVYRTISGDTWDSIAKAAYGDESYVSFLMANNQDSLEYFVFPEGVILALGDLPIKESRLPDWRE